jgi:hypothetical protein
MLNLNDTKTIRHEQQQALHNHLNFAKIRTRVLYVPLIYLRSHE